MALLQVPRDNGLIRELISKLDYSNALVPNCTNALLEKTCDDALKYGFASVSVYPVCIPYVAERLKGTSIAVQQATGFPHGGHLMEVKLKEVETGIENGVTEIDTVINLMKFFMEDYAYVEKEVSEIVKLAGQSGVGVKLIVEAGYMTDEQLRIAGDIAVNAGCEFIKTCTGFGPGRATMHNIGFLCENFGDKIKIKASGGNASLEDNLAFLRLGCSRVAGRQMMVDQLIRIGYQP